MIRVDVGNPIGTVIVAVVVTAVATGIVYLVLSTVVEKVLLPLMNVPRERQGRHVLSRIASVIALLVFLVGVVTLVLPSCGVDVGFFSLL